jgi:PAS domain S-box-containing protein
MSKNIKELLEETEKLNIENAILQKRLRNALESIEVFKSDKTDALIIANDQALKIYTEKSADQPYRILIEKMHEGAVTLNEEGTILYCNSYFANLVGRPLQKVIGTTFKNYIGDSSKMHFEMLLNQETVKVLKEEVIIYASDSRMIPALMTVNAFSLHNIFVLSVILTDLTIQNENQEKLKRRTKQLEEKYIELESINKELAFQIGEKEKRGAELSIAKTDVKELEGLNTHKEKVLATISHDLRSPLAGIIGLAELLKENFESFENSTLKEMLELLYKSSTDELSMLDSLVEWARIKYASEAFSPENIELVQYVKKIFETLNENAAAKKLHLYNEIDDSINVFADGKMLLSILQNIVSNSIKHTLDGGNITVSAKRKEEKIIVEIKDTGIGMSKELMKKLFTPQMVSLSNARKENKGAGIGLLLVKGFLEKNGGEIWAESIEGVGSSFYFTLPAMKPDRIDMQIPDNQDQREHNQQNTKPLLQK